MDEPSRNPSDGTPRAQTSTMRSIHLERSQTSQSQTSEPEQVADRRPGASEPAFEIQLRQLQPALSTEATPGGVPPAASVSAATPAQGPSFGSAGQALALPQPYLLPQQPQTAAAPASISGFSSAVSLSLPPRQPGATSGFQTPRCVCQQLLNPKRFSTSLDVLLQPQDSSSPSCDGHAHNGGLSSHHHQ